MDNRDSGYAGLLSFTASLFSLGTGLVFSVMIARRLPIYEYGIWQYYTAVMAFIALPGAMIDFWMTRSLARGRGVLNTGLLMTGLLSVVSNLLLIAISILSGPAVSISVEILLAFVFYLLLLYFSNALDSASVAIRPSLVGAGRLVLELVKVSLGVALVVWLRVGLLGALVAIDLALFSKCLAMYWGMRGATKEAPDLSLGLTWLERWRIPALGIIPNLLGSADLLILAWFTSSTVPTAYLGVARTVSAIISFSSLLAISLYPRLLGGEKEELIGKSVTTVSMLALPMAGGLIVLASPVLHVFGPGYAPAAFSLQLLSLVALIGVFRDLSTAILQGMERADVDENVSAPELMRSNLTAPRYIEILAQAINIAISLAIVWYLTAQGAPYDLLATTLSAISLITSIPLFLALVRLSRKAHPYVIPWAGIVKQVIATAAMMGAVLLFYPIRAISVNIAEVVANLLPVVALGAVVYFVVLLAIDRETRAKLRRLYRSIRSWGSKGPGETGRDSLISATP
jgi:hypothetical protein